ncbi:hypothetical protein D1B33_11340 [Lysinibacillus yapensis]|uniref:Uncharacterized protein n=1 Tax=Ureibacillus yapensis TaxID=2304605 RepID=A0A396S6U7_9BACL|nr:hypothetical protein D1B33_11340 [Lysinibacillus yapensis]
MPYYTLLFKIKSASALLAPTSAGRPESKASFQLSTEGQTAPRGAGRWSWTLVKAQAPRKRNKKNASISSYEKTETHFARFHSDWKQSDRFPLKSSM